MEESVSQKTIRNAAAITKKEKSRKERDAVKSENVARKSPSKEKVAADAKQWIKQFRKRRSELMQT